MLPLQLRVDRTRDARIKTLSLARQLGIASLLVLSVDDGSWHNVRWEGFPCGRSINETVLNGSILFVIHWTWRGVSVRISSATHTTHRVFCVVGEKLLFTAGRCGSLKNLSPSLISVVCNRKGLRPRNPAENWPKYGCKVYGKIGFFRCYGRKRVFGQNRQLSAVRGIFGRNKLFWLE